MEKKMPYMAIPKGGDIIKTLLKREVYRINTDLNQILDFNQFLGLNDRTMWAKAPPNFQDQRRDSTFTLN